MVTTSGTGEHIVGDVVNTTPRLESAAAPGSVVVGESTYRATRLQIDYEDLDHIEVKGKAEPLAIWKAIESRSRFGVDTRLVVTDTPFVGRQAEMTVFQDVFRRVAYDGSLSEIVVWGQGRCLPYGEGVSFWALGGIVKAHAGIRESDDADEAAAKLSLALEALGYEGLGTPTARGYSMRGIAKFDLGDVTGAIADQRQAARIASESVLTLNESFSAFGNLAEHVWLVEGSSSSIKTFRELLRTVEELMTNDNVSDVARVWSMPYAALVHTWRRNHGAAARMLDEVEAYDARGLQELSARLFARSRLDFASGQTSKALERLHTLEELVADKAYIHRLRFVTDVVRLLVEMGDLVSASAGPR